MRHVTVDIQRWPVAGVFSIARGSKTFVDVVIVSVTEGSATGRGEATPIYYHGESAESVAEQVRAIIPDLAQGIVDYELRDLLPKGAARNAVDAALWDLEARLKGRRVASRGGLAPPRAVITAFTLSLADPPVMEAAAREASASYPLLKLKLSGKGDRERVAAVRRGAPGARLIVDANEAWTECDISAEAVALEPYGVELIEQPVRAGQDHLLDGIKSSIPFCADESCQDRADLARCIGRYNAINIKLDKTGGLTEAIALAAAATEAGLDIMIGCMLSTSLGIAPAFQLAGLARWVDLDGPLLLASDREGGFRYDGGTMYPAQPAFWG